MTDPLKLDLGAGAESPPGFTPMGNAHGRRIFPLDVDTGAASEIRASHVLEHFSAEEVPAVLMDWVRALKPGGTLKIAVPDFGKLAKLYSEGQDINFQGIIMGGQTAADDFHKVILDEECLSEQLRQAGLVEIGRWESELRDCAALPISLNLQGTKPRTRAPSGNQLKIMAVMSVPRLGFMDNFFSAFQALTPMGIQLKRFQGAFWEQCMERALEDAIEEGADVVLTLDYDTVFLRSDVEVLAQLMDECSEVDALAPIQSARWCAQPLLTIDPPFGTKPGRVPPGVFASDLTKIKTAHFGLTMIRTKALRELPKPWLRSVPDGDGKWGAERVDADIAFWKAWEAAGRTLYSANRVTVGHLELVILWPGEGDFSVKPQLASDFQKNGKPRGIWS